MDIYIYILIFYQRNPHLNTFKRLLIFLYYLSHLINKTQH